MILTNLLLIYLSFLATAGFILKYIQLKKEGKI